MGRGLRRCAVVLAAGAMLVACKGKKGEEAPGNVPEFVLTYAENQAEDYPTTRGAYKFAELVKERTGGRIEILVHAGGALGDEQAVVEQLQYGGIDFVRASLSSLSEFVPELNVLQMPYLYKNSEHMWKVLEGKIGDEFMEVLDGSGLVGLSWYDAGARNFYCTKKPVQRLEDVKGMRIRVQESEMMASMVEALGGTAIPMTYDKVYSALETGQIDGAENNWPSYESVRHYEVAPYYTVDEHTRVPEMQLMSQYTWDKLSAEDQRIIVECARESALYERKLWTQRSESSMRRVKSAGCTIVELTDEEKERFREVMTPVYQKYCADYMDVIERIAAVGEE
ncbi:MAG: TRAP transporter substrate-binding protein [Lachnospiraceae bacterium]|nr:TRAP transporter substrate-binding protein [Lachnospiraceae bacterium]